MICGSAAWHLTVATVLVWPVSVCTLAFVLMSHTCMDREEIQLVELMNPAEDQLLPHHIQNIFNYSPLMEGWSLWTKVHSDTQNKTTLRPSENKVFSLIQGRMSTLFTVVPLFNKGCIGIRWQMQTSDSIIRAWKAQNKIKKWMQTTESKLWPGADQTWCAKLLSIFNFMWLLFTCFGSLVIVQRKHKWIKL